MDRIDEQLADKLRSLLFDEGEVRRALDTMLPWLYGLTQQAMAEGKRQALADLQQRSQQADRTLMAASREQVSAFEAERLKFKAHGVRLVLSYIEEAQRPLPGIGVVRL